MNTVDTVDPDSVRINIRPNSIELSDMATPRSDAPLTVIHHYPPTAPTSKKCSKKKCCKRACYMLFGATAITFLAVGGYYLWVGCGQVTEGCADIKKACDEMETACTEAADQLTLLKNVIKQAVKNAPEVLETLKSSYETVKNSDTVMDVQKGTQDAANAVGNFLNDTTGWRPEL